MGSILCAWRPADSELHRWPVDPTSGNVKLLLPPRQSRGNSHYGLVMRAFAEELKSAQAKYDLMCSKSIASRMQEGSDAANALWARNKWGWDRPNSTMTFKVPDQNGDIGDDNKIIIELVRAPKRED